MKNLILFLLVGLSYGQIKATSGIQISPAVSLGKGGNNPRFLVSIAITPTFAQTTIGNSANFTATGTYNNNTTANITTQVAWVSSNTSVAVIGATANPQPVTGVSVGTSNISASFQGINSNAATIQVNPQSLTIITSNCPLATQNVAYTCSVVATGGTTPYVFSISTGTLPTGLSISSSTGAITGTPTVLGTSIFTVQVTDASVPMQTATQQLSITVVGTGTVTDENFYDNVDGTCKNMGTQDGPANLPTRCFNTALANTPATGGFYCVAPNGQTLPATCTGSVSNFTSIGAAFTAIGNGTIPCGSTIKIVATATGTPSGAQNIYDETNLTYPLISCNSTHWMIVETDMIASLPPEQTRISPAWTGVASLPSRPSFNQPAVVGNYMPMIRNTAFGQAILQIAPVPTTTSPIPSFVRFIGIEIAQPNPTTTQCAGKNCQSGWLNALISTGSDPSQGKIMPDHIIFDRVILDADTHTGTSTYSVCFGSLGTATSYAIIDSYIYDLKTGQGVGGFPCEPHGIAIGNTLASGVQGPYKFVNNYIEASAENFFTGGGQTVSDATNVQVRRNHMFKPFNLWMPFQPGYLGTPMLTKNLHEHKAMTQGLVEGNIYDYTWYGKDKNNLGISDQFGTAILLHSLEGGLKPVHKNVSQDVTFRFNWVRHSTRGVDMAQAGCDSFRLVGCGPTFPPGDFSPLVQRESIHDNVWDDVSPKWQTQKYNAGGGTGGDGTNMVIVNSNLAVGTNGTWNTVTFNHNTVITSAFNQDLIVTSITTNGTGTATLVYSNSIPAGADTGIGKKIEIFGACANFNEYATIVTTGTGTFTYASGAPANSTCNSGFVSLLNARTGGSAQLDESASDSPILSVTETGTLAGVLVNPRPPADSIMSFMCIGAGVQAGCVAGQTTSFTIYGLTGTAACYNSNQANCGSGGTTTTPTNWQLAGRVGCTGLGTGNITGAGTAAPCTVKGQKVFWYNHIQSGLPAQTGISGAFFSYWANFNLNNQGPDPNTGWQNLVVTNNFLAGKISLNLTATCQPGGNTSNSNGVLTGCGYVALTGPGAVNWTCNVMVSHALIAQSSTADTLPAGNVDTSDHTFSSVGFNNFNFDNLGLGIANLNDIVLASTSPYFTGVSATGCTSDGLPTGANIANVIAYTAGVN